MYAYIHDKIVPIEDAVLHVRDLAIQRGYGIFDFFKIQDGHPFFLDDYLDRFYHSAETMRLTVPYPQQDLKKIIYALIGKNNSAESGIKMILTGGYSDDGYHPATPNLIMTQHLLSLPGPSVVREGIKIITHEYVRDLPQAKTINYSIGIWLIHKLKESGAADVLYHQRGIVSEFPRCNFFIVDQDDTVITPATHVLRGITRKNVLKLAEKRFKAKEDVVTLEDIYNAREAFLTSTTKRIVPIVQINDRVIGKGIPGPVTFSLLEDLVALEKQELVIKPI